MSPRSLDLTKRRAGVIAPLSALRGPDDCGVGDSAALEPFFEWMQRSGMSVLQLLPMGDLAPLDACPYTAISAFALDAAYLAPGSLPEVASSTRWKAQWRATVSRGDAARQRASARARFPQARAIKFGFLRRLFDAGAFDPTQRAFGAFRREHRFWLEDYSLFRALQEEKGWGSWSNWPAALRNRKPSALETARGRLGREMLFHQWTQFRLFEQWDAVRAQAKRAGVLLFGDIPFGLGKMSADVWARQNEFDFSASMGAPPDQYSPTGQAWGLPAYRWEAMERGGHAWWRARIRHARDAFDLFRIDHAIGFFRTWLVRSGRRKNGFDQENPALQKQRGERFFAMVNREGAPARAIAEDLGLLPEYLPAVLAALSIPGYKVARWEREPDGSFQHPSRYPKLSVAVSGNHDVAPLASWWSSIPGSERNDYWKMVSGNGRAAPRFSADTRRAIIENLYESRASLALIQLQDALGGRERVNTPGTVNNRNWRYRAPAERTVFDRDAPGLAALARKSGRY
ncbi:MAG: 4-alpha-glucanotransferase [Elusimicrobia bacterium CG1_02_63_36]|nr:MAG: 4-alpha-glucanotransferase [Elusimicrobia bacterium CG1_02_63_36]